MQLQLEIDPFVLAVAVLLVVAVLTAAFVARPGRRFRVPGALLFLVIGMLIGDDGLSLIELADTELVRNLGVIALIMILFEGGLTTKPTDLRLAALPGALLATVGVVVTAAVTALGIWALVDVTPLTAALIGAVVASTDAAAVFSMMRTTPLPRRLSALLRIESGANDPIAAMLTVGLLAVIEGQAAGPLDWAWFALVQLVGGSLIGLAVGVVGVWLLRHVALGVEGLYPVLALSIGTAAYGSAAVLGASGFVAVYAAGLLVGALVPRRRRAILGFNEALANAAEVGLFLMLGMLVFPSRLPGVALPALAVSGVLIFVARPLAVWVCTLGSRLGWREQAVVGWGGLRGAVPIVLATFPFTAGVTGAQTLFDIVFFVVLLSVVIQGTTLLPLVRRLGLADDVPAWAPVAEALPLDGVHIDLVELFVTEDLPIAGQRLRDLTPLERTLVAALVRGNQVLIPTGETQLLPGDVLLLTAERGGDPLVRLTAWARGEAAPREEASRDRPRDR